MTKDQFIALLEKYHRQQLSAGELHAFLDAAADPSFESLITDKLSRELQDFKADANAGEEREQKVWQHISQQIHHETPVKTADTKVRPLYKWGWAAASVILVLGIGIYLLNANKKNTPAPGVAVSNDIAPGKEGAVLTLADGSQVVLDSLGNGLVTTQNGTQVVLKSGQLSYDPTGTSGEAVAYNTIRIPKGRQFQLTLPDGSNVWLNAASSLRYPTAFTGKEREVEVTGEAYFEVTKNPSMPFKVNVNNKATIEVLGTHFNVNAYDNEVNIKTTLLEGSVKVRKAAQSKVLQPGQQAQINPGKDITVTNHADTEKVMAWKNGVFNFEGSSLEEIMRQLERWYDIEVVYEKGIPNIEFTGEMTKGISLKGVLIALEKSDVHFRLEGRKLIVLP
ncbi:FecR family protein [Chitinophaga arvensicola]|uniref:FecR protein n=1 Tax=Chitinophaga arvensicola TaxID=29529 RepID=A0A1I0PM79_9BACT|nr:FecR family protein [Chitinophaga arvensicola]SEW14918.1 FecR protein [Chitinophaga arvensicola]